MGKQKRSLQKKVKKFISRNSTALTVVGSVAAAVLLMRYFNSGSGKQLIESSTTSVKRLTNKLKEMAKSQNAETQNKEMHPVA